MSPESAIPNSAPGESGRDDVGTLSVCHVVGSLGHGGRESLIEDLIRYSPPEVGYTVSGFRVRADHGSRFEALGAETASFEADSDRDIGALLRMARFFAGRSFDVVHAHGPRAQIPCRLVVPLFGHCAVVSTIHGVPNMFPDRLLRLERLTRFLDRRTVAVSEGVRQGFVGDGGSRRWVTIRNGIDVESFAAAVEHADSGRVYENHPVSSGDVVFLNIGRYVPPKAQLDLVEAMRTVTADHNDVHLFIVGGRGAMEGRIRDRVAEHGLSDTVSVTGRVDDIHPYYAMAHAFVSSSVGEGLPIVQMEAMAAGLPVVATDIPGVRELIVDGETGVLVPPERPERLAEAMGSMLDADRRERYGRAGFTRVSEEFHVERTARDYVSLYREVIDGGR